MSNPTLEEGIRLHRQDVIRLAELLHEWHCHGDHAQDCTFHTETWSLDNDEGFVRQTYYDKADRAYNLFGCDLNATFKALFAVQTISPKLLLKLVDAL